MTKTNLSYSEHFETLVALVTHLAIVSGDGANDLNVPNLAKRLDLNPQEVEKVLNGFKGLFRRSEKSWNTSNYGSQYKYTLQLRYAHREYSDEGKLLDRGVALSNDDLFALLGFITNKVSEEQENERQSRSNRVTLIGVWIAAVLSLLSVVISILK